MPGGDLAKLSEAELIALQKHPNDWYVRTARRLLQERGISPEGRKELFAQVSLSKSVPNSLRALWALHVTKNVTEESALALLDSAEPYIRGWAIQLLLEQRNVTNKVVTKLQDMAARDASPVVRLYLASALQRLPTEQRWEVASALVAHGEDAKDHNLPLMIWYGIEPLVPADPSRAMTLASSSKIPLITSYIVRRAASEEATLEIVAATLAKEKDPKRQGMLLGEMLQAFEGRVNIAKPKSWTEAYENVAKSSQAEIREQADQIAVIFGDERVFPLIRSKMMDKTATAEHRTKAMSILVRGRDSGVIELLQQLVSDKQLGGAAIRALAGYDDAKTPQTLLGVYSSLSDAEKRDVISTLVSRPPFAMALLDAIQKEKVPRTDLHAFHVRQLLGFNNDTLSKRIQEVWGDIRATNKDKQEQIVNWKKQLAPRRLAAADLSNGRRIFAKTCATCHTLFGEGQKVGPDITGSNRANLDYILENILDPSAVLGKDYRMEILQCADGRIISGLVQKETDSAFTVRTINDTIVIAKADVEERKISELSLMPERLLDALKPEEVRDLIAYLGSPSQVSLRGARAPIDSKTKKVPGALEGESMKVLSKTGGAAGSQKMAAFTKDAWSGSDQLWWTAAKPGDKLELELPVAKQGKFGLEIVLTQARDYGIVQLSLDGRALGGPIDLFNVPDVITTGVLELGDVELTAGNHKLGVEIVGAHPDAVKAFMFGLDYVRLVPSVSSPTPAR